MQPTAGILNNCKLKIWRFSISSLNSTGHCTLKLYLKGSG
jgi:hypothetical protein